MPVSLSSTTTSLWRLERRFGTGYAVLGHELPDGSWVSAPVVLGAFLPVDDYRQDIEYYLQQVMLPGEYLTITASEVGIGLNQELPVIEVALPDGSTLSETMIARGWAIPAEEQLAYHSRRERLVAALRDARLEGKGIWHDDDWLRIHDQVLSQALLRQLGPAIAPEQRNFTIVSLAAAIIVLFLIGMRLWYYSTFIADDRGEAGTGWSRRLVRSGIGFLGLRAVLHPSDLRPLPDLPSLRRALHPDRQDKEERDARQQE
ncbi:MAG: hypothetical protein ACOCXA_00530 [Planctomycetota bacterium]